MKTILWHKQSEETRDSQILQNEEYHYWCTSPNIIKVESSAWTANKVQRVQDIRFSQQCCWGSTYSEMWWCFIGQVIPDISKALQSCESLGTTRSATKHHVLEDLDLHYKQISVWKCLWEEMTEIFQNRLVW